MKKAKKIISCILATMMVATLIPTTILAVDTVTDAAAKVRLPLSSLDRAYQYGTTVDFNTKSAYSYSNGSLKNGNDYLYNVRGWNGEKVVVAGASGVPSDYAPSISATKNTEFGYSQQYSGGPDSNGYYANGIQLYWKRGHNWSEEATYVQEFDLKVNTANDRLGYLGISLWGERTGSSNLDNITLLESDGKFRGTEVDYPVDTWFSVKMAYSYPENTWQLWYKPTVSQNEWTPIELQDNIANSGGAKYEMSNNIATCHFLLSQVDTAEDGDYAGFALDNYRIYKEVNASESILAPAMSDISADDNAAVTFSAIAKGGSAVDFCLNGVAFKTFDAQGTADKLYTYTTDYDFTDAGFGCKRFTVVQDGRVVAAKALNITGGKYLSTLRTTSGTYPTGVETFDDMASSKYNAWGWSSSYIPSKIAYNGSTSSTATRYVYFTKVTDKDGKENAAIKIDQANSAEHPKGGGYSYGSLGDSIGQYSCINLFNPSGSISDDGGILEFGFDVKMDNISNGIGIVGLPLWHSDKLSGTYNFPKSRLLGPNGEICGADNGETYKAEEWMTFRFTVDYTSSSTNPIWNVWKDGVKIITDKPGVNSSDAWSTSLGMNFGLTLIQFDDYGAEKTEETEYAGAAFDNIYARRYQTAAPSITGVSCTKDNASQTVVNGDIPAGARSVTLTLSEVPAAGYTFENVSLELDGAAQILASEDFSYDSQAKTVTVNLPNADVGQKLEIKLDIIDPITTTVASEKLSAVFNVCKTGLEITGFEREGDKVRAHFYNGTGADVSAKLVIAGYTEYGKLTCLSFEDVNVSSESKDSSIAKMLLANGAATYKVMLWNGTDLIPLTKSLSK